MKQKFWLALVLLTLAVFVAGCGGGAPDSPPAQVAAPTSAANVPQRTQAPPDSPPPAAAPEEPAPVEEGSLAPAEFAEQLEDYVLRPDDLVVAYKIPTQGERRVSNLGVIQERGEVDGKRYIVATRRVDGWYMAMERRHKEDIAPAFYESRIELFETPEGAELAISPEWFAAYQDDDSPPIFVDGGCSLGNNCIFYYYERLEPTTNLTYLQYHMAYTYRNVLVWVMGRGLDVDVDPSFVEDAGRIVLNKLESAPLASQ